MQSRSAQLPSAACACLTLLLGFVSGAARAGVYDDAAAWWHFDYDPNQNGLAETDEIRDQRDWGTTATKGASGKHATAVRGQAGAPHWTNSTAFRPAGGQEYGGKSISFQTAVDPATSNCWPDTFLVSNLGLAGSATLLTRFRWDGYPTELEKVSWLYNNALEWNAYRGWLFGVRSNAFPRLSLYTQRSEVMMDVSLTNGVWYDVAVVLTDGSAVTNDTIEFYLWRQNGALSYRKVATTVVTNSIGTGGTIIGCEASPTGYATSNARKSFVGEVNHLAVWNRALSYNEVMEAFGNPQPLFQVGIKNNKAEDLRAEYETDSEYWPGEPWHTMRRAVTATDPEATLKIPLNALQTNLNYVFHLKTLNTSQPYQKAKLQLAVNATTNVALSAGQSQDLFWPVPKEQLVGGTNTFTLRHVGGTSPFVTFDWLELGGSWQVGLDNLSAGSDFEIEGSVGDDFYITDPNWKHLERAVVQGSDSNTVLHFVLSSEMVTNATFSYTTRIVQQGRNPDTLPVPPYPFSIGVNGRILYQSATGVPDNTLVSIPFQPGDLRPGENSINLMFNSTNGWLQFDFHRLNVATWELPWPGGTLFMLH